MPSKPFRRPVGRASRMANCFDVLALDGIFAVLMFVSRLLAADGQPDLKTGFAGMRFKFDFTPVTISDDAIADDQAKAGACADGFGGEERFEHVRLHFRRNAG